MKKMKILAAALLLCACGPGPAMVINVGTPLLGTVTLHPEVFLESSGTMERVASAIGTFTLPAGATSSPITFGLRLPAGTSGTLTVALADVNASDCVLGAGLGAATVSDSGIVNMDPAVQFSAPSCRDRTPLLAGLLDATMPAAAGSLNTLNGFGFHPGVKVTIAGVPANILMYAPTSLQVSANLSGVAKGAAPVVVTNPDATKDTLAGALTIN